MDTKRLITLTLLAGLAAGCATAPKSRYGDADDDVYGSKTQLEYTQQSRLVAEMIERMMTDPDFQDIYESALERAEARGHKRPTVIVGKIEDNTEPGTSDYIATAQMRKELKTALRKTRHFAIIDLYERARMKGKVKEDVDSGAEADNIQSIGEYEAGDFTMEGEIMRKDTDGSFFHFFNLRMTDTTSGTEAWSDTLRMRKD